jgi:hypothetical protein
MLLFGSLREGHFAQDQPRRRDARAGGDQHVPTSGTCLTDVPRNCRTPLAIPFMPWI